MEVTADKYVCNKCVSDKALSSFIVDEGEEHACDYCGKTPTDLRCLTIARLAVRISEDLVCEYSDVDSEMLSYDNEEGCYDSDTYPVLARRSGASTPRISN